MYDGIRERKRSCSSEAWAYQHRSSPSAPPSRGRRTPSPFTPSHLTSGIPQLQSYRPILQVHRLAEEVDTNGRLICRVEGVVHEAGDERRLAYGLLAKEDELVEMVGTAAQECQQDATTT